MLLCRATLSGLLGSPKPLLRHLAHEAMRMERKETHKALLKHYLFLLTFSALVSVSQSHKGNLSLGLTAFPGPLLVQHAKEKQNIPISFLEGRLLGKASVRCQQRQTYLLLTQVAAVTPRLKIKSEAGQWFGAEWQFLSY